MLFNLYYICTKYDLYMNKEPEELTFSHLKNLVKLSNCNANMPIISQHYGIVANAHFLNSIIPIYNVPYRLEKIRIAIVKIGEANVNVNLIDRHYTKNTIVFLGDKSIIQLHDHSDDFDLCGFIIDDELLDDIFGGHLPSAFSGQISDFFISIDDGTRETLVKMFESLLFMVKERVDEKVINSAISSLFLYFNSIYEKSNNINKVNVSHTKDMFYKFINLVNQMEGQQRSLDYYSDKMCVSARYLGTVVKQESGKTSKWWIDRSVISCAKVLLRHSDLQVVQISDKLKFANVSFFCKYFRRITGLTPQEYRQGK